MSYGLIRHKIFNSNEEDLKEVIEFVKNSVNCSLTLEKQIEITKELINLLYKKRKIELIGSILDFDFLKSIIVNKDEEQDFFIHCFILTNIYNRNLEENVSNSDYFIEIVKDKELKTKIIFNLAISYRDSGDYKTAVELLKQIDDIYAKLELAVNYSKLNDKKELLIYNELSSLKLTIDEKLFVFLGYSKYFMKIKDYKNCKNYLNKTLAILPNSPLEYRTERYYEISEIYHELGENVESYFFLKKAANCDWTNEKDLEYKLKAIIDLQKKGLFDINEAKKLISSQSTYDGNGIIKQYLNLLKEA